MKSVQTLNSSRCNHHFNSSNVKARVWPTASTWSLRSSMPPPQRWLQNWKRFLFCLLQAEKFLVRCMCQAVKLRLRTKAWLVHQDPMDMAQQAITTTSNGRGTGTEGTASAWCAAKSGVGTRIDNSGKIHLLREEGRSSCLYRLRPQLLASRIPASPRMSSWVSSPSLWNGLWHLLHLQWIPRSQSRRRPRRRSRRIWKSRLRRRRLVPRQEHNLPRERWSRTWRPRWARFPTSTIGIWWKPVREDWSKDMDHRPLEVHAEALWQGMSDL